MPNGDEKNWTRLCAAVDGFKARFGVWPKRIRLTEGALSEIRDHVLEPDEFERVSEKLDFVCEPSATMVAELDKVRSYDYGTEGFPDIRNEQSAEQWLLTPIHSDGPTSGSLSRLAMFLADENNSHKLQGNLKVRCNALYKNRDNVNALLTAGQAIELAYNLLRKAQIIIDHDLSDAAVHLWNQGSENERLYCGLNTARKGPRRKKSS